MSDNARRHNLPAADPEDCLALYTCVRYAIVDTFEQDLSYTTVMNPAGIQSRGTLHVRSGEQEFTIHTLYHGVTIEPDDDDVVDIPGTHIGDIEDVEDIAKWNGPVLVEVRERGRFVGGTEMLAERIDGEVRVQAWDMAHITPDAPDPYPLARLDAKAFLASLDRVVRNPRIDRELGL